MLTNKHQQKNKKKQKEVKDKKQMTKEEERREMKKVYTKHSDRRASWRQADMPIKTRMKKISIKRDTATTYIQHRQIPDRLIHDR